MAGRQDGRPGELIVGGRRVHPVSASYCLMTCRESAGEGVEDEQGPQKTGRQGHQDKTLSGATGKIENSGVVGDWEAVQGTGATGRGPTPA